MNIKEQLVVLESISIQDIREYEKATLDYFSNLGLITYVADFNEDRNQIVGKWILTEYGEKYFSYHKQHINSLPYFISAVILIISTLAFMFVL